jgi:hypothetical protein
VAADAKGLFGADIDEALVPSWRQDPLLSGVNLLPGNGLLDDPHIRIMERAFSIGFTRIIHESISHRLQTEAAHFLHCETGGASRRP